MRYLALLSLVAVLAPPARGEDPAKAAQAAFKPIRMPPPSRLEKDLVRRLPGGIVIESGPFDALVERTGKPFAMRLAAREAALQRLAREGHPAAARLVRDAVRTVVRENSDRARRVTAVEQVYAEVYDKGYMESGEKTRRNRKLAAVLIPLFRGISFRNAALAEPAGQVLARLPADEIGALARGDRDAHVRRVACRALAIRGGDEARDALRAAVSADPVASVRHGALIALMSWKASEIQDAVLIALGDRAWELRALAIAYARRARLLRAVGPLIAALEGEQGRLRDDIEDALHDLTGVRMYGDVALWKSWWAANRAGFEQKAPGRDKAFGPPASWEQEEQAPDEKDRKREGATSAFYGIRTLSKRILFVVDISRSMQTPAEAMPPSTGRPKDRYASPRGNSKLNIAQWQLHRAVEDLPQDATFNVIVYSESYKLWVEGMSAATPKNKRKAHAFVDALAGNGTTNIADPIDKAFEIAGFGPMGTVDFAPELAADTIFLLSDGDPNRGRISDLERLLEDVTTRARNARIVIHAVGIGEAAGSSFLQQLASRTSGHYVGYGAR